MKASTVAASLAAATGAVAQRPMDMSICDYYTTALLKENNATNQETLLTLVVNTAVIGNYTMPNVGIKVPGILANGTGEYEGVSLLPYFSGGLVSTNAGGMPKAVNFLDDGGAAPLMMNKVSLSSSWTFSRALLTMLFLPACQRHQLGSVPSPHPPVPVLRWSFGLLPVRQHHYAVPGRDQPVQRPQVHGPEQG